MNDSFGALLALGVLYVIFRSLCGRGAPSRSPSTEAASTARMRAVPDDQVASIRAMFPQIPEPAIRADLARSRSTQATAERILRDGSLPMPRTGLFPPGSAGAHSAATPATASPPAEPAGRDTSSGPAPSSSSGSPSAAVPPTLLERYGLAAQARKEEKGKDKAAEQDLASRYTSAPDDAPPSPPPGWSHDRQEREQVLRQRKAAAILQARK